MVEDEDFLSFALIMNSSPGTEILRLMDFSHAEKDGVKLAPIMTV